ncbi:MAG: hypothetical protein GX221_07555 [Candidatus Riflebacteria bacterium]|nr:hypothetical protein [Candidatus Riflebacteria bacterium]
MIFTEKKAKKRINDRLRFFTFIFVIFLCFFAITKVYAKVGAGGIGVVMTAANIDGRDYVLLNITWQAILTLLGGTEELYAGGGRIFTPVYSPEYRKTFYQAMLLSRKHGVKTKIDFSLASAACPSCGASQTEITDAKCPYCGNVPDINSGAWFLEDVMPIASVKYQEALDRFVQSKKHLEFVTSLEIDYDIPLIDIMKLSVLLSSSDGVIADSEMEALKKFADRCGISQDVLSRIILELKDVTDYKKYFQETLAMPRTLNVLKFLIRIALIDGVLEESEKRILNTIASLMHYTERDLERLIDREIKAMLKMGKEVKTYVESSKQ